MFGIAFHPNDPKQILFGGDMGAMYQTENNGTSWKIVGGYDKTQPAAGGVYTIARSPHDPSVIFAGGTYGIYLSEDNGKTWRWVGPEPFTVGAIAFSSTDPNLVYAVEGFVPRIDIGWGKGRFFKSKDGGKTWKKIYIAKKEAKLNFSRILVGDGGHIYIAGRGGLYASYDNAESWQPLPVSSKGFVSDALLLREKEKQVLLVSFFPYKSNPMQGIYRSEDGGKTWEKSDYGLGALLSHLHKKHTRVKDSAYLYSLLLTTPSPQSGVVYAGSWQGIARSDNFGKTWRITTPKEGTYLKDRDGRNIYALANTDHFKKSIVGGIDHFNRFHSDPSNPLRVAFTDNQDLYISEDGGKRWESRSFDYLDIFDKAAPHRNEIPNRFRNKVRSRGVQNLVALDLIVDPTDPKTYYIAYMDVGLQISRDGGETWEHPNNGIMSLYHARALSYDLKRNIVFVSVKNGGIYASSDKGKTWKQIANVHAIGEVYALYYSKYYDTLFAAGEKNGDAFLYRYDAQQNAFKPIWKNLADKPTLIEGAKDIIAVGTRKGAWFTSNLQTFNPFGKKFGRIKALKFDPKNTKRIYIVANSKGKKGYWDRSYLFKSTDGGKSFTQISLPFLRYPSSIAIDPNNSRHLLTCSDKVDIEDANDTMRLYESFDAGKRWRPFQSEASFARCSKILYHSADRIFVLNRFAPVEIRLNPLK